MGFMQIIQYQSRMDMVLMSYFQYLYDHMLGNECPV